MTDETELYYEQFMKALASRIRELRKERGLSLRDMVLKHGYHDSQWRRYERNGAPSVGSLLSIARALNLSLSVLLDGLGEFPLASGRAPAKHTSGKKEPATFEQEHFVDPDRK